MRRLLRRAVQRARATRWSKWERISMWSLAALIALWLIENWIGERFWLVLAATYLPQQPLIIFPLLLLAITAWRRERRAMMINALALLFFGCSFGGIRVPLLHSAQQAISGEVLLSTPHLRVLTFNLNRGERGVPGLLHAIREQNPDVICLQETKRWLEESQMYEEIRAQLPAYTATTTHEVAIFSRYPVLNQRAILFPNYKERAILETVIDFAGRRVRFFSIHVTAIDTSVFSPRFWRPARGIIPWQNIWRRNQVETLLAQAAQSPDPTIICGDFNTPPRGRIYRRMRSQFTDTFATAGWGAGNSFTSEWPLLRIDYIWSSSHWRIQNCWVPGGQASDHRAVVADFTLP